MRRTILSKFDPLANNIIKGSIFNAAYVPEQSEVPSACETEFIYSGIL